TRLRVPQEGERTQDLPPEHPVTRAARDCASRPTPPAPGTTGRPRRPNPLASSDIKMISFRHQPGGGSDDPGEIGYQALVRLHAAPAVRAVCAGAHLAGPICDARR